MRLLTLLFVLAILLSACGTNPTNIPSPTIATTKTRLPTLTPRPTLPITLNACVTNETIRIRKGPGTQYDVVGGLVSHTCITISGRNKDSSWVYITTDDNITGWVGSWLLTIDGSVNVIPVRADSEIANLIPTTPVNPYLRKTNTPQADPFQPAASTMVNQSVLLCSQTGNKIGQVVSCKIERAYCDYLPSVEGSPTFCNDRPYPNQNFALVVFGENWSDYDGLCLIVSGTVSLYDGVLQIQAFSRSQVSFC